MLNVELVVKSLARHLSGKWIFDALRQTQNSYYLHDRNGIYILFQTGVYKKNIPQISINYLDPRNEQLRRIAIIGCSLNKSIQSIKTDIETRLFCELENARAEREKVVNSRKQTLLGDQYRFHMVSALSQVFEVEKRTCSYTFQTYDLVGLDISAHHGKNNNFNLTINDVSLDDLIKIGNIIKEGKLKK